MGLRFVVDVQTGETVKHRVKCWVFPVPDESKLSQREADADRFARIEAATFPVVVLSLERLSKDGRWRENWYRKVSV